MFFITKSDKIFSCDSIFLQSFHRASSFSSRNLFSFLCSRTRRIAFIIFGSIAEYFSSFCEIRRVGIIFSSELLLFSVCSSCSCPSSILMLTSRDDCRALSVRISFDLFGRITILPFGIVCGKILMIDLSQRHELERLKIIFSYLLSTLIR